MKKKNIKIRVLRYLWGLVPWLIVFALIAFIVDMGAKLKQEKSRLEQAKKEAVKKEVPAVRVITLAVKAGLLEDKIGLPAEVEPFEDLWVKAEVSGQVVKILVKEGQMVRKGQVLMELDARDYRSRLARIEANYRLAELEHDRYSKLAKENIAAESKLDETEARLNDLIAQQNEAKLALSRTKITAPIGGRLNEIKAKLGNFMGVGDEIGQILQFGKVKVTVGVPESDVAACFNLKEAEVVIEALGNRRLTGKKMFLSRKPRTLARLYDLELMVPNPDGRILPGMFAKVELVKAVYKDALAIPLYAVITQGDERYVYVENGGKAIKKPVELGVLIGWQVHIKEGLSPGDRVIVVGHRFLDHDQVVEVIKNVTDPKEILES